MTDMPMTDVDREELDLLLRGFQVSRTLRLIADLAIADKIPTDGRATAQELAATCAVQPEPLLRVLRALAAFRIFQVTTDGVVAHTPRSRLLRTDTPNSMHHAARFWTAPGSWGAWGMLDVAMTSGIPQEAAWNVGRFAYLREHADEARVFDAMMANSPDSRLAALAAAYDFSGAGLIADIGGGNGAALRHILARFPAVRGSSVPSPPKNSCTAGSPPRLAAFSSKCRAGPISTCWSGFCIGPTRIACASCGPAARRWARIRCWQILEPDPARGRATGYLIDIHRMAMFGRARERSEVEFRHLLDQSGFSLRRIIPTGSLISIIEAAPEERGDGERAKFRRQSAGALAAGRLPGSAASGGREVDGDKDLGAVTVDHHEHRLAADRLGFVDLVDDVGGARH
jgi:hypothetical protein